jgi:hypothetical protein
MLHRLLGAVEKVGLSAGIHNAGRFFARALPLSASHLSPSPAMPG